MTNCYFQLWYFQWVLIKQTPHVLCMVFVMAGSDFLKRMTVNAQQIEGKQIQNQNPKFLCVIDSRIDKECK